MKKLKGMHIFEHFSQVMHIFQNYLFLKYFLVDKLTIQKKIRLAIFYRKIGTKMTFH